MALLAKAFWWFSIIFIEVWKSTYENSCFFGVVPRGPGDPLVSPGRARAERWRGPRVLWGIKGVEETRSKDIFDLSRSGPKARRIYIHTYSSQGTHRELSRTYPSTPMVQTECAWTIDWSRRWFREPPDVTWSRSGGRDVFRVRVGGIGRRPFNIYIYTYKYIHHIHTCMYIYIYIRMCIYIYI